MSAALSSHPQSAIPTRGDLDRQLGRLVLTLCDVIRQLLERQAERRATAGALDDAEIERVGTALLQLANRMDELKRVFGLAEALDLRLGLLDGHDVSLVDTLDRVLTKGVVLQGDVVLSLADVDLVRLGLRLVAAPVDSLSSTDVI